MTEHARRLSAKAVANLLVDTSPYLSCDECFSRIDQYVDRRAADPSYEDLPMEVHLTGCGACAEEAEALLELARQDAG